MINVLYVGLGGFIGSIGRYVVSLLVKQWSNQHWFPFGTMTVNVLGCFLIGLISSLLIAKGITNDQLRLFLLVGVLGGFTTFSSFGLETIHLFKSTQSVGALVNVLGHMVLCIAAAWIGHNLGSSMV